MGGIVKRNLKYTHAIEGCQIAPFPTCVVRRSATSMPRHIAGCRSSLRGGPVLINADPQDSRSTFVGRLRRCDRGEDHGRAGGCPPACASSFCRTIILAPYGNGSCACKAEVCSPDDRSDPGTVLIAITYPACWINSRIGQFCFNVADTVRLDPRHRSPRTTHVAAFHTRDTFAALSVAAASAAAVVGASTTSSVQTKGKSRDRRLRIADRPGKVGTGASVARTRDILNLVEERDSMVKP